MVESGVEPGDTPRAACRYARVGAQLLAELPKDLYIPPDALEVFLETFEGPLDLLLYLIKRENLDILDIPIAEITRQYVQYIELMKELRLELAAEYLLMAAMLAEIKSRMLLPMPPATDEELEGDPRAELVRRLQEYERYKQAAQDLDALPRVERDIHIGQAQFPDKTSWRVLPEVSLEAVVRAFGDVMQRAALFEHHHIQREPLSVRERMTSVLNSLTSDSFSAFSDLFSVEEGRAGVVVTLLAVLELTRQSLVEMVQNEPFGPIYVKAAP